MSHLNCYDGHDKACYDAQVPINKCNTPVFADIFLSYSTKITKVYDTISPYDKHSKKTLYEAYRSFLVILPTLINCALARIIAHRISAQSTQRFLIEFVIIIVPVVIFISVGSQYSDVYVIIATVTIGVYAWRKEILKNAKLRTFDFGKHPAFLTLVRATTYIGTGVAILAIDFESFPKSYRKSRRYGAAIMDAGIGLFVLNMGMVARRAKNINDILHLASTVVPLIFLGLVRTTVISIINYHQDEYEYGQHLNAFFILGFTKLFGSLLSMTAHTDVQLLPLSLSLLVLHEIILQSGLVTHIMDPWLKRDTLLLANREGVSSMPGFISMYLFAISFSSWLRTKSSITYYEMLHKLRAMLFISISCWLFVIYSAYTWGIARVVCNAGYAIWVFAMMQTFMTLYIFVFDFLLNTALPLNDKLNKADVASGESIMQNKMEVLPVAPVLAESINSNGLIYFLLANVLTGMVNMFLAPDQRSNLESVLIVTIYMFISTGFVYMLYRKHIRIG